MALGAGRGKWGGGSVWRRRGGGVHTQTGGSLCNMTLLASQFSLAEILEMLRTAADKSTFTACRCFQISAAAHMNVPFFMLARGYR